jgi:hypothetical protein
MAGMSKESEKERKKYRIKSERKKERKISKEKKQRDPPYIPQHGTFYRMVNR